jgi:hypothetical protein
MNRGRSTNVLISLKKNHNSRFVSSIKILSRQLQAAGILMNIALYWKFCWKTLLTPNGGCEDAAGGGRGWPAASPLATARTD